MKRGPRLAFVDRGSAFLSEPGGKMRDMNSLRDWLIGYAASRPRLFRDRRPLRNQWLLRGQRLRGQQLRHIEAGAW